MTIPYLKPTTRAEARSNAIHYAEAAGSTYSVKVEMAQAWALIAQSFPEDPQFDLEAPWHGNLGPVTAEDLVGSPESGISQEHFDRKAERAEKRQRKHEMLVTEDESDTLWALRNGSASVVPNKLREVRDAFVGQPVTEHHADRADYNEYETLPESEVLNGGPTMNRWLEEAPDFIRAMVAAGMVAARRSARLEFKVGTKTVTNLDLTGVTVIKNATQHTWSIQTP